MTTLATVDVCCGESKRNRKSVKFRVLDGFQWEVNVFVEIPEFPHITV